MMYSGKKESFAKAKSGFNFNKLIGLLSVIVILSMLTTSCKKKEEDAPEPEPSVNLALDSLVATKKNIVTWEEIYITAYARGNNLTYKWSANHGSMIGKDSVTVLYYACDSCVGLNTIECKVTNEYGTVSDTIMIRVNP